MRIEVRTDMMEREREKESDVAVVCVLIPFSCVRRLYKGERERERRWRGEERREREWGIGPIGPLRHGM